MQITKKTFNRSFCQRFFIGKISKNYFLLPLSTFALSSPVAWMSSTALAFWSSSKACGEQEHKISVTVNKEKINFKVFMVLVLGFSFFLCCTYSVIFYKSTQFVVC